MHLSIHPSLLAWLLAGMIDPHHDLFYLYCRLQDFILLGCKLFISFLKAVKLALSSIWTQHSRNCSILKTIKEEKYQHPDKGREREKTTEPEVKYKLNFQLFINTSLGAF